MRRIGVPPVGVAFFFLIASRLEDSPGDYPSLDEYELHRHRHSHPVAALRILKIAEGMQSSISAFARLQRDKLIWEKKLQDIVVQLREIASGLDNRRMRLFLKEQAEKVDVAAFRSACSAKSE